MQSQAKRSKKHVLATVPFVVAIVLITIVFYLAPQHGASVLHLYFLPVVLAGIFHGRHRAGTMALLCVVLVCAVASNYPLGGPSSGETVVTVPGVTVWAGSIGMAGLAIGTLSDRRRRQFRKLAESQRANALTDPLTGMANRRVFQFELSRRLSEWNRRRTSLALVLLDVDHFKKFNDTYGHQVGDIVLRGVARAAQSAVREVDLVARYGGEEFAIVLPGTDLAEAKEAAERVRRSVESTQFECGRLTFRLTISVGLAHVLPDETSESLIRRADGALYHAKQAGRNCAFWHNGQSCEHFGESLPSPSSDQDESESNGTTEVDVYTDRLTGLPSRKVFHEELRRRVSEAHRYKTRLSVLFVG